MNDQSIRWGIEPSLEDLVWMIDTIPGYTPTDDQMDRYREYKDRKKVASWKARQQLKEIDNFKEPFPGFFAGVDLFEDGAPARHYRSIE
jgi:hypothetical protein